MIGFVKITDVMRKILDLETYVVNVGHQKLDQMIGNVQIVIRIISLRERNVSPVTKIKLPVI